MSSDRPSPVQTQFDVLIIGAGPAGSAAGILLARAGWSVGIVEKQAFPRRKVCGECVAATNMPLLDALGVGDQFESSAGPDLRRVAFMQDEHTVIADLPAFEHHEHPWGRALGRETLDTLLLEQARAAGAAVYQPWSVRAVEGEPGNFSCAIRHTVSRDTQQLRAGIVIAAHGSWELLPSRRAERRSLRRGDLLAFKANFAGASLEAGLLPVLSFDGGYGGMVIADADVLTLACCIRADRLEDLRRATPGASAGDLVGGMLQRECWGVRTALRGARREGAWLAAGPLNPGVHFRSGDLFFRIGNAAGEAHPIIGEGMSMALQSAWLLCEHLLTSPRTGLFRTDGQQSLRDCYEADWRSAFTRRLRLAAAFAHVAMRPGRFMPPLSVMRHFAPLLTHAAKLSGKVSCAPGPATIASLAGHGVLYGEALQHGITRKHRSREYGA